MASQIPLRNRVSTKPSAVHRERREVEDRIRSLMAQIELNDVWVHSGYSSTAEPNSKRKKDLLEAKVLELKWILGEEISISEGV